MRKLGIRDINGTSTVPFIDIIDYIYKNTISFDKID